MAAFSSSHSCEISLYCSKRKNEFKLKCFNLNREYYINVFINLTFNELCHVRQIIIA